ncbi:2-dehydro-3-deoxyglucarate aldolase/4-hydroxy-2-oxoheptanedioate aldolase [Microbacterium thalassium]|uniref:2-dehydro-3-deoxyglucarate aldolase/4-hydroxy-2-oxoheptanedioate aldolase n=2 Tax=Microbacterium thalassium TaxID=362649 RepID=A0A7X0KTZ7_9MICO|nr:aldolase/citrate lyase family protein [Microbacterium thalassium]MBB6390632.1 2-dehydro-3-deoxyglucarate aldolase/4-hydroxy-2-oxoheptanedioate aldolase [Microbacterium thalassium]
MRLKTRIQAQDPVVGTFVLASPRPAIARAAVRAGADFVLVDGEHTGFGWETIGTFVSAVRTAGGVPFVRVPAARREYIGMALDMGAVGLMVPMVGSADEAREIVSWAKYPPTGVRGAMFGLAGHDFDLVEPNSAMWKSNADTILMLQIETQEGLDNVEEIAAVEGVDILWIGHWDLSISMGIPTQFEHERFQAAVDRIVAAAAANGKAAGFLADDAEHAAELVARGFRVLAWGSDLALYRTALSTGLNEIRDALD